MKQLTATNDIPVEVRPLLKRLRPDFADSSYTVLCTWDWDTGECDWEISMRDTQEDVDFGYIAVVPTRYG
jgi:hypothetical protein